jgi:hypothetical protein
MRRASGPPQAGSLSTAAPGQAAGAGLRASLRCVTRAVIGVVGGSGGVGASTFAAALARGAPAGVLLDVDPLGGGADVLLGLEHEPGARWSGVRVGGGHLDSGLLADQLPRWGEVPVLALDGDPPSPDAAAQVLAACGALGVVAVDLGRAPTPLRAAVVEVCTVVVIVARAEVAPLVAAHAVRAGIDADVGAVLRPGCVPLARAAHLVGAAPLARLPDVPVAMRGARISRRICRVAAGVLDGVLARPEPARSAARP